MTINKTKPNEYSKVAPIWVEDYIIHYNNEIHRLINNEQGKKLRDCNKTQLNAIAAELDTAYRRLSYIIDGCY